MLTACFLCFELLIGNASSGGSLHSVFCMRCFVAHLAVNLAYGEHGLSVQKSGTLFIVRKFPMFLAFVDFFVSPTTRLRSISQLKSTAAIQNSLHFVCILC